MKLYFIFINTLLTLFSKEVGKLVLRGITRVTQAKIHPALHHQIGDLPVLTSWALASSSRSRLCLDFMMDLIKAVTSPTSLRCSA